MKQGWEIKKLGEVSDFQGGSQPPKDEWISEPREGYIRMLQIRDFTQSRYFEIEYVKISNRLKYCNEEDVLLGRYGASVGKVLTGLAGAYNVAIMKTIPNKAILTKRFFKYFLLSPHFQSFLLQTSTMRAAQAGFSKEDIYDYPFNLPQIEEQERIVAELDCLSGIIERKREQLRELDALAQSIFYQMFGDPITNEKRWEVKKIKDIFSVKIGPFGSLLHNSDYISGGTPLVNPIHMHNERICPDFDFTVSDDKLKELGNYILHIGDIVLARRGDIGRCALVGENEDGYLCGTGSLFIRPIKSINSEFVISLIRCSSMIECLTSLAKGATMLNINCKIVEDLNIVLPPLALQQEFADKIEAIEKQKELIKQSITQTEELFNSRMDYYFN